MNNYWLVKTEEDVYPISQLKIDKKTIWDCVRNYQARNYLTSMKKGDLVLIYHSNSKVTGVAGLAEVSKEYIPDPTQFDKKSDYYDPKATSEKPRWFSPTLSFKEQFKNVIPLSLLKEQAGLKDCPLLRQGNRLSVLPLTAKQAEIIMSLK